MALIILAVVFGAIGVWTWSLVDILRRSEPEWKAIGQDRTLWLILVLFVGMIASVGYFLAIRPKFEKLKALGGLPIMPVLNAAPAGWYPDPAGAPMMRWFDGRQWTPQTAAMGTVPMGGAPVAPPAAHAGYAQQHYAPAPGQPYGAAPGHPPAAPGYPPQGGPVAHPPQGYPAPGAPAPGPHPPGGYGHG